MTNPQAEAATFLLMTRTPIRRPALACLSLLLPWSTLRADEPALSGLLRDALYTEEVARDSDKAAKQYEELLARHDAQKTFAAAALFRLAEVRRKQDRKDDAIQLYQRLIAEFPNAETETKLARENLAALGGKMPAAAAAVPDKEAAELARLQGFAETAPDILLDPNTMFQAAHQGWASVVKFLLANGGPSDAEDALRAAARNGNLEIVKLLTDAQAEVPDPVAAEAIWAAIDTERIKVLEYLLEKGFKPGLVKGNYGNLPNFIQAVLAGRLRGAEVLLKHGVDINTMADAKPGPDYSPCGTALHFAIQENNFDVAKWLLEKGAKPDLPDPIYGLSPLHHAVKSEGPGAIEMTETLLVAGADPNRRAKDVYITDDFMREYLMNSTPLEVATALTNLNLEHVKPLLKHGADPNLEDSKIGKALVVAMGRNMARASELVKLFADAGFRMTDPVLLQTAGKKNDRNMIELLLKHGANPEHDFGPNGSLLAQACKDGNADRIALLLKAGADVNEVIDGRGLVQLAARSSDAESALSCVKVLLDAGAKPDEEWKRNGYVNTPIPVRKFLLERVTIPELGKESEINLLVDKAPWLQTLTIATRTSDSTIPDLAPWLLKHHTSITDLPSEEGVDLMWAIWRKGESSEWAKQELDILSPEALPGLRWGDVVTCSVKRPEPPASSTSRLPRARAGTLNNRLPDAELWHLRKRISFPITVETDGTSREIQVRGDRLFFDPTKDEVPLGAAQIIAGYLWQRELNTTNLPVTMIVSRKDWPDIRLTYPSIEALKFQLQAGDRLKLEIPISSQVREDMANALRQVVTLKAVDYPFEKILGVVDDGKSVPASIPTLIQALADTQAPESPNWKYFAEDKKADLVKMYGVAAFHQFTLLPHPDLANIRIRRLMDNGAVKVIEVNLAGIIAASTDQTTAEDAKKADVMLQPGDVVEISLLKDRLGEPWKGFNSQEEAFFAKALIGRVRVTDGGGYITVRDLLYKAPRFFETDIGWVPLPPETGVPSVRGSWLIREGWMIVRRDNASSENQQASGVFIRDGDDIQSSSANRTQQTPPQPSR
jgi:ankyrin repeat protein